MIGVPLLALFVKIIHAKLLFYDDMSNVHARWHTYGHNAESVGGNKCESSPCTKLEEATWIINKDYTINASLSTILYLKAYFNIDFNYSNGDEFTVFYKCAYTDTYEQLIYHVFGGLLTKTFSFSCNYDENIKIKIALYGTSESDKLYIDNLFVCSDNEIYCSSSYEASMPTIITSVKQDDDDNFNGNILAGMVLIGVSIIITIAIIFGVRTFVKQKKAKQGKCVNNNTVYDKVNTNDDNDNDNEGVKSPTNKYDEGMKTPTNKI